MTSLLALWGAFGTASASAADTNSLPPQVKVTAAGAEGIVGPRQATLARFETEAPDSSWEYAPDSPVSFACSVDGRPVPCVGTYNGCCRAAPAAASFRLASGAPAVKPVGLGGYSGTIAVPDKLATGPHAVSVAATDEDGTGPAASVEAIYDATPPSAPELTQVPPRASHLHKPFFRYSATDDVRLIGKRDEPFRAELRRLDEFSVLARDAVGNKSPLTAYRFRILPGRPR